MSGFLKTVSNLGQNFFACPPAIAGREAFGMLEKAGGLPSRRVGADIPGPWLPAGTKRGEGGRGESRPYPQSGAFGSVKVLIFLAGQP